MTEQEMIKALHEVLDERDHIDAETHADHHTWLRNEIKCQKIRRDQMGRIKTQVIGWSIISAIGAIAAVLWYAMQDVIYKGRY